MKTPTTTPRNTIGFKPSYMINEPMVEEKTKNDENEGTLPVDPVLADLQDKIVKMTLEFATKRFARLSTKTKLERVLDYNMLVQIETRLLNALRQGLA